MVYLAFPWLALEITGSAASAGLLVALSAVPGLVLSPIVGAIIDRVGRKKVAIAGDALAALAIFIIPLSDLLGGLNFAILVGVGVLRALFAPASSTARKSLVADAAREGRMSLERTNSIHEAVFATGFAIGPALSAVLIAIMGPTQIFWITGTFMVIASSVALFLRLHEDMGENPELSRTSSLISDTVLGFRAVAKVPVVLVLLISIMGLALIYLPTEMVVLPAHFNALGDPTSLGIIISTMAGASVFGALGFELLDRWLGKRRLFRAAIIAIGVSMLPMALLPDLWLFLACGAVLGLAWGPLMPMLNTVIQTEIDPAMRGRVFAIEMTIWNAAPLISMVLVGLAVDALGVALVYLVLSGLVLLGAAVVTGMPATRSLPGPIRIPVSAGR
ncbi:MAG: hypothetical protein RL198_386 [Actinomycetota bacterium]